MIVLDCTCLLEKNKLCNACSTSRYNMSTAARLFHNRLVVQISYNPLILENLIPNEHFFTGIFNMKIEKLRREIKSINFVQEVEPAGYGWDGKQVSFDTGGFQQEEIICQDTANPDKNPQNFTLEKNAVCRSCSAKGHLYFCDVVDRECDNVKQFKERVLNSDLKSIKCEVKILPDEPKYTETNMILITK